jgi:hypothetical protein
MPYSSDQQRKWAHTAAGKKALGGEADVHEWDEASKGKKLPKYAKNEELGLEKESEKQGLVKVSGVQKLHQFLANRKGLKQS